MKKQNKTVGFGFVGTWKDDNSPGWFLPRFIHRFNRRGNSSGASRDFHEKSSPEDRAVLCKITIEQIFNKNGRPITRKPIKETM